jgi:predicted enzyme related to lactoylglutathione lyase
LGEAREEVGDGLELFVGVAGYEAFLDLLHLGEGGPDDLGEIRAHLNVDSAAVCGVGFARNEPGLFEYKLNNNANQEATIMRIGYTKVYVNDQDKALKFYTESLGFVKTKDVKNGDYRWLSVGSPDDKGGAELVLELNANPAFKDYQKAVFEQNMPANNFDVEDVQAEYERLKKLGVKFTMEPMQVMPGVTIAMLDDGCGNLIQIQKVEA